MMKNEKGITLVSLIITIITIMILIGVSFSITLDEIDDARNNRLWGEIGMVRQAVVEQYQKALAVGKTGVPKTSDQLDVWIGEKITSRTGTEFFPDAINAELESQGISKTYMFSYDYNDNEKCKYQEDCCYELNPNKLGLLGIEDVKHTYIVNYKTGEVYNETKPTDYSGKLLYLIPVNYEKQTITPNTQSFNDWTEELNGGNS